jgi:hypothetical protein
MEYPHFGRGVKGGIDSGAIDLLCFCCFWGTPKHGISFAACSPHAFIHQSSMLHYTAEVLFFLQSNLHQFARIRPNFANSADAHVG